jgi:polysaccharide pyruvyl transferase WcaK-like protein
MACQVQFQDFEPTGDGLGFDRKTVLADIRTRRGPVWERLQGVDLIVDTGAGDSFTDLYGMKRHFLMSYVRRQAQRLGIPIIFGPQTIGPFVSRLAVGLARRPLRASPLVLARDSSSLAECERLAPGKARLSTDVVFAIPQPERQLQFDVILNVSGLLWSGGTLVDGETYRENILDLVRGLRASGRNVTLMPHVLDSTNVDNDVPTCSRLAQDFGLELVVPETLADARAIVSAAAIVVGSRMHACLNALSVGTPAVPLAYSRKFAPLMSDLGWEHTIDLKSAASPAAAALRQIELLSDPCTSAPRITELRKRADELLAETRRQLAKVIA